MRNVPRRRLVWDALPGVLLASLFVQPTRAAENPVSLGPLGGAAYSVVVDPTNADVVLVAGFGQGVLRSLDGGLSFATFGAGLPAGFARALTHHPTDPAGLFVIAGGTAFEGGEVLISADFGASWASLGLSDPGLRTLAVGAGGNLLLAAAGSRLFRSADGGSSWATVAVGSGLNVAAIAPSDPSVAWYGTFGGAFVSADGGASFAASPITSWTKALAVDPADASIVYCGTTTGVQGSVDGGARFTLMNGGITGTKSVQVLAFEPGGARLWLGTLSAVLFSADPAAGWTPANEGFPPQPMIPTAFGFSAGGDVFATGEASDGGLWRTYGGVLPWVHVGFAAVPILDVLVAGPGGTRAASSFNGVYAAPAGALLQATGWHADFGAHIEDMTIDPSDPSRWIAGGVGAFIDNANIVVFTGDGSGASLVYERFGAGRTVDIVFQPGNPGVVLAGMFPGGFGNEAIARSQDGGATWTDVAGTAGWATRALAFDPFTPERVLELSDNGQWAQSVDAGRSWGPLQPAWPVSGPSVLLAFDPFVPLVLYRGETGGGLWRSDDVGATWTALGISLHADSDLELHPDAPGLLFVSDAGGAVWLSGDRGDSFVQVFEAPVGGDASGLALDASTGALVVGTTDASAWEIPGASPIVQLGAGTQGTDGYRPRHYALGGLPQPGNPTWGLGGADLLGGATVYLVVGLSEVATPYAGGTLFAGAPYLPLFALPTGGTPGVGGSGGFALSFGLPPDPLLLGATIVSQLVVLDSGGPGGFSKVLSPGLRVTFGP